MSQDSNLDVYLTDHMAGSVSAHDLASRAAANNAGEVAQFFADLAREIEIDRKTLADIAAQVGTRPNPLKQAGAVAAERLSRFKIDHRVTGSPQLSLLLELELLYLGIQGKHTLWRSLDALGDPRLAAFDFGHLTRRAEDQMADVEQQRLTAVRHALAA
jgi:hypothetical protein